MQKKQEIKNCANKLQYYNKARPVELNMYILLFNEWRVRKISLIHSIGDTCNIIYKIYIYDNNYRYKLCKHNA